MSPPETPKSSVDETLLNQCYFHLGELMYDIQSGVVPVPKSILDEWKQRDDEQKILLFTHDLAEETNPELSAEWLEYLQDRMRIVTRIGPLADDLMTITRNSGASEEKNFWRRIRNCYFHVNEWNKLTSPFHSNRNPNDLTKEGLEVLFLTSTFTHEQWLRIVLETIQKTDKSFENLTENELVGKSQRARRLNSPILSDKNSILNGLEKMGWKKYIPVKLKNQDDFAIDHLVHLLNDQTGNTVVEINGIGGLGKTALMYELIRRILDGNTEEKHLSQFEEYIILTSKSKKQGEVDTEADDDNDNSEHKLSTQSPGLPKYGPRSYLEDLNFRNFIYCINSFSIEDGDYSDETLHDQERAIELINTNRWLIVLDNFEDCSKEDKENYFSLFKKLIRQCESRIVITGRPREKTDFPKITLDLLQTNESTKLMKERYVYLSNNFSDIWQWRSTHLEAFDTEIDFIPNLLSTLENEPERKQSLARKLGHPLALFRLTTLMGKNEAIEKCNYDNLELLDYLRCIVTSENNGFVNFHNKLDEWVIDKAYGSLENDESCKTVLRFLGSGEKSIPELMVLFSSNHFESTDVGNAVEKLNLEGVFIQEIYHETSDEPFYSIQPPAFDYLLDTGFEFEQIEDINVNKPTPLSTNLLQQIGEAGSLLRSEKIDEMNSIISSLLNENVRLKKRKALDRHFFKISSTLVGRISKNNDLQSSFICELLDALFSVVEDNTPKLVNGDRSEIWIDLQKILSQLDIECTKSSEYIQSFIRNGNDQNLRFTNDSINFLKNWLFDLSSSPNNDVNSWLNLYLLIRSKSNLSNNLQLDDLKNYWPKIRDILATLDPNEIQWIRDYSSDFIDLAQYDETWDSKTFKILDTLEILPEYGEWEDIKDWEMYSCPPDAPPGNLRFSPSDWDPETEGLSYATFDLISQTHQFEIVSSYQTKKVLEYDAIEQPIEEESESFISEGLMEFIAVHQRIINDLLVQRPSGFSANQVNSCFNENQRNNSFEWKDESWKFQNLNKLVSIVTEGKYSKWGRWFTDMCESNIFPNIVYSNIRKGKKRKGGLGTILPRSQGDEVEDAKQKIQKMNEINQLKRKNVYENISVSWFHRPKKAASGFWRGYPNQPLASKYLSLLVSASPEKIWKFDESIDFNYFNANLSWPDSSSYIVSNHKYVCPECNTLLKIWSNARRHKKITNHHFSQKEAMVKNNTDLPDILYPKKGTPIFSTTSDLSALAYAHMVRINFGEWLKNNPQYQRARSSEKATQLGLNIAFSIAYEIAENHSEDSLQKIRPPSSDECYMHLKKNIDTWISARAQGNNELSEFFRDYVEKWFSGFPPPKKSHMNFFQRFRNFFSN